MRYPRGLHPPEVRIAIVLDNFGPHPSTKTDTRVGDRATANNAGQAGMIRRYTARRNRHATTDPELREVVTKTETIKKAEVARCGTSTRPCRRRRAAV